MNFLRIFSSEYLMRFVVLGSMAIIVLVAASFVLYDSRRFGSISLEEILRLKKSGRDEVINDKEAEIKDSYYQKVKQKIKQSGVKISVTTYFLIAAVAAVVIFSGVLFLVDSLPAAVVAAFAGLLVPSYILGILRERRMRAMATMFSRVLKRMIASLQSNSTLLQAIDDVIDSEAIPKMMREEMAIVRLDFNYGDSLDKAFRNMYQRTGLEEIKSVALAVEIAQEQGSDLSEAFSSYVSAIQEREEGMADARATLAGTKTSVNLMSAMPFIFALFLKFSQPDYFDTVYAWGGGLGRYFILSMYLLVVFGFIYLHKKCDVKL